MQPAKTFKSRTVSRTFPSHTISMTDFGPMYDEFQRERFDNESSAILQVTPSRGESSAVTLALVSRKEQ